MASWSPRRDLRVSEPEGLDRSRRYLRPVPRVQLPDEPDVVHLALYGYEPRVDAWVSSSPALCGHSAEQGDLPMDATVTCPRCLACQPQYEAVLERENSTPPVQERRAARKDPRYAVVLDEVRSYGWPAGHPMVPDLYADNLATRIMCAIRAQEATGA